MSNELAIATERGQSMAELMGISSAPSKEYTPSVSRLKLQQMQPIMGEVELNGKMVKTEVVPIGSFKLETGDEVVYSDNATVRIFAQRWQYQRFNKETGEMEKTVLVNSTNGDMKDSIGGFNLGRPKAGYISTEEYDSYPAEVQDVIKSVNIYRIYYGTVTMDNPINDKGEKVTAVEAVPFIFDVKNADSKKSMNAVLGILKKKNMLPIMSTIKLKGTTGTNAGGGVFGKFTASLGDPVELISSDNDMLKDFLEFIEHSNGKILDLHYERAKGHADEDQQLVEGILNNDFVEVDE